MLFLAHMQLTVSLQSFEATIVVHAAAAAMPARCAASPNWPSRRGAPALKVPTTFPQVLSALASEHGMELEVVPDPLPPPATFYSSSTQVQDTAATGGLGSAGHTDLGASYDAAANFHKVRQQPGGSWRNRIASAMVAVWPCRARTNLCVLKCALNA